MTDPGVVAVHAWKACHRVQKELALFRATGKAHRAGPVLLGRSHRRGPQEDVTSWEVAVVAAAGQEEAALASGQRGREKGRALGLERADQSRLADFVSDSPAMQEFMDVARRVVPASSSLLILGETGVGKEHLALAAMVHYPWPATCGS
jgi:DNA replication protein DnaC